MSATGSVVRSSPRHVSITSLPEDALFNIFSYLVFPGEHRHLFHMKHALVFALISQDHIPIFKSLFTRITFPSTTRYYSVISDPNFIASLVTLSSDALKHLELPQVCPDPVLLAAKDFCPHLVSLSYFESFLREKALLSSLLLRCASLKSLTIHDVTKETFAQLQDPCNVSQLSNLTELALCGIDCSDSLELQSTLLLYSGQLQNTTLQIKKRAKIQDVDKMIIATLPLLGASKSLRIIHYSKSDLSYFASTKLRTHLRRIIHLLSTRESIGSSITTISIGNLHIFTNSCFAFLRVVRSYLALQPQRITLETPAFTCIASFSTNSPPEVSITSISISMLSTVFINQVMEHLRLRHVKLQANLNARRAIGLFNVNESIAQVPNGLFSNVKSVFIDVMIGKRVPPLYFIEAQALLPLLPELDSFTLSIAAIFDGKLEILRQTMEIVKGKRPRVLVINIDNLLPPYLAIYCPSQGPNQRYAVSRTRLFRLGEFIRLLKDADSVKEVVMEGDTDWKIASAFMAHMAKMNVAKRERGLRARMKLAGKLLQEVTQIELERDVDMTSVIGWFESMAYGNSSKIVCPCESELSGPMDLG